MWHPRGTRMSTRWRPGNAAAATASSSGVVTAVGAGATTVTATYQNASGTLVLTLQ
jgi:hypothetical protein